jgi:hypothetical protein
LECPSELGGLSDGRSSVEAPLPSPSAARYVENWS